MPIILTADFIFDNLAIQLNVIRAAFLTNVNRLLYLAPHVFIQNMQNNQ